MGVVTDALPDEGGGDTSTSSNERTTSGPRDPFRNEFDTSFTQEVDGDSLHMALTGLSAVVGLLGGGRS